MRTVQSLGPPMHRLLLEVTEDVMAQETDFQQAVAAVRETGCLLALRGVQAVFVLDEPGVVQMTRPDLSLHGARMCVTLSVAVPVAGRLPVLCVDIDWVSDPV